MSGLSPTRASKRAKRPQTTANQQTATTTARLESGGAGPARARPSPAHTLPAYILPLVCSFLLGERSVPAADVRAWARLRGNIRSLSRQWHKACSGLPARDMAVVKACMHGDTAWSRTLVLPAAFSLFQLHLAIQDAFNFEDRHLHRFQLSLRTRTFPMEPIFEFGLIGDLDNDQYENEPEELSGLGVAVVEHGDLHDRSVCFTIQTKLDERAYSLCSVLTYQAASTQLEYEYDFGDNWEMTLELICLGHQVVDTYPRCMPRCISGAGSDPIEDSGGRRAARLFSNLDVDARLAYTMASGGGNSRGCYACAHYECEDCLGFSSAMDPAEACCCHCLVPYADGMGVLGEFELMNPNLSEARIACEALKGKLLAHHEVFLATGVCSHPAAADDEELPPCGLHPPDVF